VFPVTRTRQQAKEKEEGAEGSAAAASLFTHPFPTRLLWFAAFVGSNFSIWTRWKAGAENAS